MALEAADAMVGQPVGAIGPPDDAPDPGAGLAGPALTVEFDDHVGAQDGLFLLAADPLIEVGRRLCSGGKGTEVEDGKHRVQPGRAGWPVRWRAAWIAQCRTASGLRAGMPSPWR